MGSQKLRIVLVLGVLFVSGCDQVTQEAGSIQAASSSNAGAANTGAASSAGSGSGPSTQYPGSPVLPLTPATQRIYTHSGTYLYAFDPRNNSETLIGRFSPPGGGMFGTISDIAVSNSGVLIGISCLGLLYQINPSNAELTLLMNYPGGGNAITFLSNGKLIAAGGTRITTIDLANRTITPFTQDQYFESSGDIVALPDGFLYETVVAGASDNLVQINPSTGHTVVVGSVGFKDVAGLAYADGKLYGFNLSGTLIEINPATGRGTAIGATSLEHYGAASSPVAW